LLYRHDNSKTNNPLMHSLNNLATNNHFKSKVKNFLKTKNKQNVLIKSIESLNDSKLSKKFMN
jgi:hypothetical protein